MLEGNIRDPHIDDLFSPGDGVIEDREYCIESRTHRPSTVDSYNRPDSLVLYLVEVELSNSSD